MTGRRPPPGVLRDLLAGGERAVVAGVTESTHAALCFDGPVAATVRRRRYPDHRLCIGA